MNALDTELNRHVQSTANRLRMVQIDFADQDLKTQNEFLCEELERALKSVAPEKRSDFLKALQFRFPTCSEPGQRGAVIPTASVPQEGWLRPEDIDGLAEALVNGFKAISKDQQNQILERLNKGGLISAAPSQREGHSLQAGGSSHLKNVDPDRLIQAFVMLLDFVAALEPLAGEAWRTLAHRGGTKTPKIKALVGRYIELQSTSPDTEILAELRHTRLLMTAMLASISQVGRQFSKKFVSTFSPRDIAATVRIEGGSFLVSHEVKCWKKYEMLANSWTEDIFEEEIRKVIVEYVSRILGQSS